MYFVTPFATSGDRTAIPATSPIDGSVSYDSGYGPDYQLDPDTDPSALDVERNKMNELFFQISKAVQRLQQFYAPDWIAAADNEGVPFAYNNGAIVLYTDGHYWQSIVAANVATPNTDPTKWIQFLSNYATGAALAAEVARAEAAEAALATAVAQAAPPGLIGAFAAAASPAGWLVCDGTSYLRSAFPALAGFLGSTYGGDATHFNVPDFRSMFLRGFLSGTTAAYGTNQLDAEQAHTHHAGIAMTGGTTMSVYSSTNSDLPGVATQVAQAQNAAAALQPNTSAVQGARTATETRPINFAVNYCIKT